MLAQRTAEKGSNTRGNLDICFSLIPWCINFPSSINLKKEEKFVQDILVKKLDYLSAIV